MISFSSRNAALNTKIIALTQRHQRHGADMIYLKLRQNGMAVNHKQVDQLYTEVEL